MPETKPVVLSPEWWRDRLGKQLAGRQAPLRQLERYYRGTQPLAFASEKFRQAFGNRFAVFTSNYMSLVVDAHRERLHVQGIRIGDAQEGDTDAWSWWQRNRMDSESQKAHTESLVKRMAYALVWPDADGQPIVTIEDPLQMIVETEPGRSWRRRAALKRWLDEETGRIYANVYLPDGIYKWQSEQKTQDFSSLTWGWELDSVRWSRRSVAGEPWPVPNKLGIVPIVPIVNRPRLDGDGDSEIAMVLSNQDAIDKYRADALVASEFASFRQRFAIGIDVPVDPITGQPFTDITAAVSHLWIFQKAETDDPNASNPTVGEFDITPLEPYFKGIESETQAIASITRTPYHYFLQHGGQPPSGESLRSAEAGLLAKVRDSQLHKGQGWEEVFRLQFAWLGDPRASEDLAYELIWRDPEFRTESEHVDALVKMGSLGIPQEVLWEKLPATPSEIARWRTMQADDALTNLSLTAPPNPTPQGPQQPPQGNANPVAG